MGAVTTVVGVKRVDERMPPEEWDDSMPLPGDIVKGVALVEDEDSLTYCSAKNRSELSGILSRLSRPSGAVWVKVQRGNAMLELRARVTAYRGGNLYFRFTLMAARDDRHVAVLGDLSLERCTELQEMSRTMVSMGGGVLGRKRSISYDWKKKVGIYLPDRRSTLISSILFKPFRSEQNIEATTGRSMAWFSAAVSSGVPLVFINIQTEQISSWREMSRTKYHSSKPTMTPAEQVLGIRLWFLPGITELPVVLTPEEGDTRFGLDMKRTEEGFIYINSVSGGSAADRAGLGELFDKASKNQHLVVISRLEGREITPSEVSSEGLIRCCDQASIKERLAAAIEDLEEVHLHIMCWPNHEPSSADSKLDGPPVLLPPADIDGTFSHMFDAK
ncbi:hypothetical protein Cni_G11345 [Canna indica]|uniref:Uncharacterized protein n=1 Tax=Canna indica TaxID=4628 RepID=A0AAQ3QAS0_9LILI|nr:hypothetical protein Cni_G11345 [Canna indica]